MGKKKSFFSKRLFYDLSPLWEDCKAGLQKGDPLFDFAADHGGFFSPYELHILASSPENPGDAACGLADIVQWQNKRREAFKDRFRLFSGLFLFVFLTLWGINTAAFDSLGILCMEVSRDMIPAFKPCWNTLVLIRWLTLWILPVVGAFYAAGLLLNKIHPARFSRHVARLPVFGRVLMEESVIRFTRLLDYGLERGIPLKEAFACSALLLDRGYARNLLMEAAHEADNAEKLSAKLFKINGFPQGLVAAIQKAPKDMRPVDALTKAGKDLELRLRKKRPLENIMRAFGLLYVFLCVLTQAVVWYPVMGWAHYVSQLLS